MKCVITSVASRVTRRYSLKRCAVTEIENSLHWVLDVTFAEDASRIRRQCPAELFLVAAFGRESAGKKTVKEAAMKRYRAGLDNNYLAKVD